MAASIRRIVTIEDEILAEAGRPLPKPIRRVAVAAVIRNPFAGRFADDLEPLIAIGEELGGLLGRRALDALGGDPKTVESFGKGAIVGGSGELEHAAALLHPKLGAPLRAALAGGIALIPSAKKIGAIGTAIDVPLGHKDAAKVRSHFDAMTVAVPDAPRADEIVVALVLTDGGRPWPRVGGLAVDQVQGRDGLI